jgi:predicted ATP-grasp superfamily ATP-dependent carboligase
MRVINFDGANVTVIDTEDTRLPHGVEDLFTPKDFKKYFDIDYSDCVTAVYEPYRKMYVVERKGQIVDSFDNPEDDPLLAKIKLKEEEIIDFLILRHLKMELPSKYHYIKDYKYVLPEKFEKEYQKLREEKEAYRYLMDTVLYAIREIEETLNPNTKKTVENLSGDDVMQKRQEAYEKISTEFWEKKNGLRCSEASADRIRRGVDPKKAMECSPKELKELMKKGEL